MGTDILAATDPFDLIDCVSDENVKEWNLELFDGKGDKPAGNIILVTQLIAAANPPINPRLNYNC